MRRVFANTYFYLAVLNPRDAAHARVMKFIAETEVDEVVTTAWVLAELADGLNRPGERQRCAALVEDLRRDEHVRLIEPDVTRFWRGFDLYRDRPDKNWSLTDCISFVVMEEEGLRKALTGDHHFSQAGFEAVFAA